MHATFVTLWLQVMQPLANVHETKWTPHVKRESDVAVHIIAVVIIIVRPLVSPCRDAGWEGSDCDVISNDCIGNACINGATCQDGDRKYTCTCRVGFTGETQCIGIQFRILKHQ